MATNVEALRQVAQTQHSKYIGDEYVFQFTRRTRLLKRIGSQISLQLRETEVNFLFNHPVFSSPNFVGVPAILDLNALGLD